MSTNANRLDPSRYRSRNRVQDDGLSEDGTSQDVSDSSVRTQPHLLETEFLDSSFIGSDRCTLDGYLVLLGSFGRVDCDLVVGSVSVFDTEIKVLELDVDKGKNELREGGDPSRVVVSNRTRLLLGVLRYPPLHGSCAR